MTLNFQQVFEKIKQIGAGAKARQELVEYQRQQAKKLLLDYAHEQERLRAKVERAAQENDPNLRCAIPTHEALDARFETPAAPPDCTLLAIDGSQITPDRHAALHYGLVNIGAIVLQTNSGRAPDIFTESELLFEDELRTPGGSPLNESGISLRRDAAERAKMLELAARFPAPLVSLTDGPIELWGAKDPETASSYQQYLQKYLSDLQKLARLQVTLGGYVDKPGADLVVRLLEVAQANPEDLQNLRVYHPLTGATDKWLFGALLAPGERSAVFAMQSSSRKRYTGELEIHFFYLNVGLAGHAAIARVEIPQWVADDERKLNLLHATLIQQARQMGAKPYPYILHRAHETAKVSFDEKTQVETMLGIEIRARGGEMDENSNKQSAKELKTRF
jgi:hypothetical protein